MNPSNTTRHKHTLVLGCSTLKSKAESQERVWWKCSGEWGLCQQGQDSCPLDKLEDFPNGHVKATGELSDFRSPNPIQLGEMTSLFRRALSQLTQRRAPPPKNNS